MMYKMWYAVIIKTGRRVGGRTLIQEFRKKNMMREEP